ncbi:MAG: (2Fe-2S)-binding protein [Desulfobacterales bacterium]|nr:(2Fe-2S)-binding protein [Desulfobacterales bacterium]
MKIYPLEFRLNGETKEAEVGARETLLDVLRNKLGAKDVKNGCAKGDCGACAVLLDGKAVNACLTLALQANGRDVTTVRGIGREDNPDPLQVSFVKHGAIQCGYCTPGMIVSAKALLKENPKPDRHEIREAISGNLCRCTGYNKIVEAIEAVTAS